MKDFNNYNNNYNNNNFYGNDNLGFEPNQTKNSKGPLFIFSIIFFVLGFLISCLHAFIEFRHNAYDAYNIGISIGYIIWGIVFAVILYLLAMHVFKKKGVLLGLSIIYILGTFSSLAGTIETFKKEAEMNKAAEAKLVSICNSIAAKKDISGETFDKSVYGDLTPLLQLIKDYGTEINNLSANMTKELSSVDFANILSLDTLSSQEKISDAKKKIDNSLSVFDKYETEYNNLVANLNTSVPKIELPKAFKKDFINGFRDGQVENRDITTKYFKIEKDLLSKTNEILNFMLSAKGNYIIRNNQLLFETDADVNKYNEYIKDIKKLAEDEEKIQNSINDKMQNRLNELNKYK